VKLRYLNFVLYLDERKVYACRGSCICMLGTAKAVSFSLALELGIECIRRSGDGLVRNGDWVRGKEIMSG
jgi:hypothetical protein